MARKFSTGLYSAPQTVPQITLIEAPQKRPTQSNDLLILLLLFVLLAASPSLGLDSSYFFIIIMAIIGLGGVEKAFGINIQTQ